MLFKFDVFVFVFTCMFAKSFLQGLFTDEIREIMLQRPGTRKSDKIDEVWQSKKLVYKVDLKKTNLIIQETMVER